MSAAKMKFKVVGGLGYLALVSLAFSTVSTDCFAQEYYSFRDAASTKYQMEVVNLDEDTRPSDKLNVKTELDSFSGEKIVTPQKTPARNVAQVEKTGVDPAVLSEWAEIGTP